MLSFPSANKEKLLNQKNNIIANNIFGRDNIFGKDSFCSIFGRDSFCYIFCKDSF